jgi:hypothetical protein
LVATADRYGIQEAIDDGPGSGSGLKYLLIGGAIGAGIGYAYSLYYNEGRSEKIATDGCVILGGLLGTFVLPFVYIVITK